jgi:hypothetical protein
LIGFEGLLRRREEVWSRESIVGSRKAGEYRTIEQGISNDEGRELRLMGLKGLLRRREEVWSRESIVGSR